MKRVLLTGASGFLGSHCLRHILLNTDWHVVCPVSFAHRGVPERIVSATDDDLTRVDVIRADLACPIADTTAAAFGDIDTVINYASQSHVDRSIADPVPFVANNVAVMLHLLDWAVHQHRHLGSVSTPQLFLHISTDEVYGPAPPGLRHVEWSPIVPSSPYAASKAAQEALAISWWRTYRLPLILVNSMNLIGEMQDAEKYVPTILRHVLDGTELSVHATGGQVGSRHYLHARDLADAVLFLLRRGTPSAYAAGADRPDRWHVAGANEVDNLALAHMVAAAAGKSFYYRLVDAHSHRPGHDLRYALDSGKINVAGWVAPVGLDKSLERTVRWTLEHPEWLRRQPQL